MADKSNTQNLIQNTNEQKVLTRLKVERSSNIDSWGLFDHSMDSPIIGRIPEPFGPSLRQTSLEVNNLESFEFTEKSLKEEAIVLQTSHESFPQTNLSKGVGLEKGQKSQLIVSEEKKTSSSHSLFDKENETVISRNNGTLDPDDLHPFQRKSWNQKFDYNGKWEIFGLKESIT